MAGIYSNLAKLARIKLPGHNDPYALIDLALREMTAPVFADDSAVHYNINDIVIKDNELFVCVASTTGGTWNSEKWQKITIASEFKDLKAAISGGIHYRGYTATSLYENCTTNPIIINGSAYTVETGDLVIETPPTYETGVAYTAGQYVTYDGIIRQFVNAVTAIQNISWAAVSGSTKNAVTEPEFIFDGSFWNEIGTINPQAFGKLAYKDSAQGTYTAPTGSGLVTFTPNVTSTHKKLTTVDIYATDGTESVTAVSGGSTKDIAKVGTAVRYGTADVGTAVTYGTANRATSATRIGNADVGDAVTYGTADIGTAVVYGKANVGPAVTYGTADVDTAVNVTTGVTVNSGGTDFATEGLSNVTLDSTKSTITYVGSALGSVGVDPDHGTFNTNAIKVGNVDGDLLTFTDANNGIVQLTTTPAATSNFGLDLTPASKAGLTVTNTNITPAVVSNKTLTPAVAAPNDQKIAPAVASSKTLTPAKALSNSSNTIYEAVTSTTTLTPAVAASNNQTLTPAVSNGQLTGSYTLTNHTVAKAATNATTVATGALEAAQAADTNKVVITVTPAQQAEGVSVGTTTAQVTAS